MKQLLFFLLVASTAFGTGSTTKTFKQTFREGSGVQEWNPANDLPATWHDCSDITTQDLDNTGGGASTIRTFRNKGVGNPGAGRAASFYDLWTNDKGTQVPLATNYRNGFSVCDFPGTKKFTSTGATGSGTAWLQNFFPAGDTAKWTWIFYIDAQTSQYHHLFADFNGVPTFYWYGGDERFFAGSGINMAATAPPPTTFKYVLISVEKTGATAGTAYFYINGVLQNSVTTTTSAMYGSSSVYLFGDESYTLLFKGHLGESIFFPGKTHTEMLSKGSERAANKWAIAIP